MSNFIHLDSIYRDRETYPNENNYQVVGKQLDSWFRAARNVTPLPPNPSTQPLNFVLAVNIRHLVLPYSADLAEMPLVFVDFHCKKYQDIHLVSAINGTQPDARFICSFDKIQNDSAGTTPLWIHYKCNIEQVMRFERGDDVSITFTTRSGAVLTQQDTSPPDDADPTKQSLITFELTPYLRDGDYSEQAMITPLTS